MDSRLGINLTPEVAAWRKTNPIRRWLDASPKPRGARLKQLKARLGVTKAAVFKWMHGISLPSSAKLVALARIVESTPSAYLHWWGKLPGDTPACVVQPRPRASRSKPARS